MKNFGISIMAAMTWFLSQGTFAAGLMENLNTDSNIPIIGIEYCPLDNVDLNRRCAQALSDLDIPAAKHLPENVSWGIMQKRKNAAIDFERLDHYVREYQMAGFTHLVICLKSQSKWAARDPGMILTRNVSPKPEYMHLYEKWIQSIVERYDEDGHDDMPGLRYPFVYLEIGSEFSSFEPEPVDDYIDMLEHAYQAAHRASSTIRVAHAAFLTTGAFIDDPSPAEYESAFEKVPKRIMEHSLADIRRILDRPDIFDCVNIHNLGDPYEIEPMMKWLDFEMSSRNYKKPVIISDTVPTSFIGWGPATTCKGPKEKLGLIGPPATEADRCRLADFFNKLIGKDLQTLHWTRSFIASDMVQRTIIAAEQQVELINLAFTGDLPFLRNRFFKASAGLSAWAGMLGLNSDNSIEKRPLFYAIQQLNGHLKNNDSVKKMPVSDSRERIYSISNGSSSFYIAWFDPQKLFLPEDSPPEHETILRISASSAWIEPVITSIGQSTAQRIRVSAPEGQLPVILKPFPMYVFPVFD